MNLESVMAVLKVIGGVALALPALVSAIIAICMAIPGDQPEKFLQEKVMPVLQKVVDFISKFSAK